MTLIGAERSKSDCAQVLYVPLEKRCPLLCEVNQLSAGENCINAPAYAITISYLGRPALTLKLCKVHILDTWHLAQTDSEAVYGNDGHVKSVAVKKLEE